MTFAWIRVHDDRSTRTADHGFAEKHFMRIGSIDHRMLDLIFDFIAIDTE